MALDRKGGVDESPKFVRAITDSVIHIAAAAALVGVNFSSYFEIREETYAAEQRIKILRAELELEKEKKIMPKEIEERLKALEAKSHDPKDNQQSLKSR